MLLFLVILMVTFVTLKGTLKDLFQEISTLAAVYGLPTRLAVQLYEVSVYMYLFQGYIYI